MGVYDGRAFNFEYKIKKTVDEKYGRLPARGECLTDRAASKDGCQGLTEAFTARPRHPSHLLLQSFKVLCRLYL